MTTLTTKVARKIMNKSGKGTMLFNDKLESGGRSLKVWGWGEKQYLKAKRKLEKKGCRVDVVVVKAYKYGASADRMQTRLHVFEPNS